MKDVLDHEYDPKCNVELVDGVHKGLYWRGIHDRVADTVLLSVAVEEGSGEYKYTNSYHLPDDTDPESFCLGFVESHTAKLIPSETED